MFLTQMRLRLRGTTILILISCQNKFEYGGYHPFFLERYQFVSIMFSSKVFEACGMISEELGSVYSCQACTDLHFQLLTAPLVVVLFLRRKGCFD